MKKSNLKKTFALLTMMFVGSAQWTSAATRPDVTGAVVDENNQPLEFVSISLLAPKDSTYIQGAVSNEQGKFRIITPETGGIVRLSCIGYKTVYVNVNDIEAGRIILPSDAQLMSEVTVKGMLPKTKLTGNSMVTKIEGTVLGQSGTAKEMLSKVPGMTQKGDDLEVLGKGTPIYYINGRKMQDADELKRLRSEEIQSVEVITNPGAEYDATVTAVVRIKTLRRQGDGFGFDLSAGNSLDLAHGYTDPNATLNLRYRHNNLDVFGMVNYWKWDQVNDNHPDQQSWAMRNGVLTNIHQDTHLRHDWHGQGFNYNLGFNYQIGQNHSLGMRVEKHDKFDSGVDAWIGTEMTTRVKGLADKVEQNGTLQDSQEKQPYNWDGNAYYNGQLGKLGIDFNFDFMTNKTEEENIITEWDNRERKGEPTGHLGQSQDAKSDLLATKLVLSYPVWKGQLQTGTEMSFVTRTNNYAIMGYPLPATQSEVKEKNIAGFVQYACEVPVVGSFSAGLRYEHVGFDYLDLLNSEKSMTRYNDDFFPSLSWSKTWKNVLQTSLAYSVRTIRPSYSMLDEGTLYVNSYSLQQGNPKLKNATMHEISANVRYKWLTLFMAYERRNNAHSMWSYIYNDEGVILVRNINLEKPVHNFATFLMANPTFGIYSANWTAGIQRFFYKLDLADPREASGTREVSYDKPIMIFDLNNAFRLKHRWQLEANMNIMTKGDVMNYRMTKPSYNLRFAIQKCWLKNDALCLRATISDVLQKNRTVMEMDCGYYVLNQQSVNSNHRLEVSLRYTFNAASNKYKGTGAGKDAQNRLGDGNS